MVLGLQLRGCDSGLGACPHRALSTCINLLLLPPCQILFLFSAKSLLLKTHGTIQEFIFSLYRTTPLPGTALTELSQKVSFRIQQKEREACHKFFASYAFLLRHSPGFEIQQLLIVDRGGSKEFVRDAWDCIIAACFIWMGLDFCLHYLEKD